MQWREQHRVELGSFQKYQALVVIQNLCFSIFLDKGDCRSHGSQKWLSNVLFLSLSKDSLK